MPPFSLFRFLLAGIGNHLAEFGPIVLQLLALFLFFRLVRIYKYEIRHTYEAVLERGKIGIEDGEGYVYWITGNRVNSEKNTSNLEKGKIGIEDQEAPPTSVRPIDYCF
ncbi:hypothetical protein L1887_30709 [Cichorium endivia]|nr:hypothetical protein L1887_30709 [Cichorium endivia]